MSGKKEWDGMGRDGFCSIGIGQYRIGFDMGFELMDEVRWDMCGWNVVDGREDNNTGTLVHTLSGCTVHTPPYHIVILAGNE